MDVRLLFPSLYLRAADLQGKDAPLTIRRVVAEDLRTDGGTERKAVCYFEETRTNAQKSGAKEKRLVLNKTNALMIAKVLGSYEINDWTGKRITLYPDRCQSFGETVDCIRVRDAAPETVAEAG